MRLRVALLTLCMAAFVQVGRANPPPGYVLTWSDEFNGTSLDPAKWRAHNGPRENAVNTPNAVSVTGGNLVITTYTENHSNFTGFIDAQHLFERVGGYFEARIAFQTQRGTHSAFWLQSPTVQTVGDPEANGVEIDIFEHRHSDKKGNIIADGGDSALHWDGYGASHKKKVKDYENLGVGTGFHNYGFLWTSNQYCFYVDDKEVWKTDAPISKHAEFIRLTSEVDRSAWSGKAPNEGYGKLSSSTNRMLVDYVRVYAPVSTP